MNFSKNRRAVGMVLLCGTMTVSCTRPIGTVFDETPAVCGNGILDPGEECDDGNLVSGDGCDEFCRVDTCVPETEVCNGIDDDCDGLTDEDGVCNCTDPTALEPGQIQTVPGPSDAADPTIAWSGSHYGVAWNGGFAVLDGVGTMVESHAGVGFMGSESADVVYSAIRDEYVMCWSSGADINCGLKVLGDSHIETVMAFERPPQGYSYNNPRVAYRPATDDIATIAQTGSYGSAFFSLVVCNADLSGCTQTSEASQHQGLNNWDTGLTPTEEGYAFVYAGTDEVLYLARFDQNGQRLAADVAVTETPDLEYLSKSLLWDGAVLTTAWSDFRNVHFVRFDKAGTPLTERQLTYNESEILTYMPILAQGPWVGMIWQELHGSSIEEDIRRVRFVALDTQGTVLREIVLSDQGIYPWVASDGQTYLTSWREGDLWDPDIAFVHIGCHSQPSNDSP